MLSLLVHLALLAFFWIGLSWQSLTPTTVEAEIWDTTQRDAAPPAPEPIPEPVPEPPKPAPEPKPPAPVVAPEPPKAKLTDPDIALAQEKKRQQQKEKEKLAEEKQQREDQERKQRADEQKRQKEEQALIDKKKLEEEQKRKQELAEAEEQKRKEEAAAAEELKRKQEKAAERRREKASRVDTILTQAGNGEDGTAEKKSGARGSVCELFIGKTVKSNTSFPDMPGNPIVTVMIRLTASRMLKEVKVVKPSEYPEFDRQVERGIRKSGQFPAECPDNFDYEQSLK